MNPETKEFEPVPERPDSRTADWKRFHVGEVFTLNGVPMAIRKITRKDLILRPVNGQRDLYDRDEMPG